MPYIKMLYWLNTAVALFLCVLACVRIADGQYDHAVFFICVGLMFYATGSKLHHWVIGCWPFPISVFIKPEQKSTSSSSEQPENLNPYAWKRNSRTIFTKVGFELTPQYEPPNTFEYEGSYKWVLHKPLCMETHSRKVAHHQPCKCHSYGCYEDDINHRLGSSLVKQRPKSQRSQYRSPCPSQLY